MHTSRTALFSAMALVLATGTAAAMGLDPDKITGLSAVPAADFDAANKKYWDWRRWRGCAP